MVLRILLVTIAYLIGAIPFGYLLVRYIFTSGEDIRRVGSGGTGATNVTRRAGRGAGLLTYLLDMAKGLGAVLLMRSVAGDDYFWIGAAGTAAILGHMFPVFIRFRGGKGVATGVGVFVTLAPYSVLSAVLIWAVIVYATRYVSLGSILAVLSLPILNLLYYGLLLPSSPHPDLTGLTLLTTVACALIVARHHQNIGRLLRGTENKTGERPGVPRKSTNADPAAVGEGRIP